MLSIVRAEGEGGFLPWRLEAQRNWKGSGASLWGWERISARIDILRLKVKMNSAKLKSFCRQWDTDRAEVGLEMWVWELSLGVCQLKRFRRLLSSKENEHTLGVKGQAQAEPL